MTYKERTAMTYKGPGKYLAVCNNTNFDGHYVVAFEIPEVVDLQLLQLLPLGVDINEVEASWYFLNIIDVSACIDDVYPAEIFEKGMQVRLLTDVMKERDEAEIQEIHRRFHCNS